jgi:hypothetical protein
MRKTVLLVVMLAGVMPLGSTAIASPQASNGLVGLPAWDRVSAPVGTLPSQLRGVHTISPTDVWTVGIQGTATLIERWNGSSFSIVPSPNVANRNNWLEDIDGVAPDDIWAVGHADDPSFFGSKSLAQHWDGSSWTIVPTPNVGSQETVNNLTGVDAVASNNVWAVGTVANFSGSRALIMRWNGTAWRFVRNDCGRGLNKVDARTSTDIWAVGNGVTCHWNGSRWTQFPVGLPPSDSYVDPRDVTVVSANNAWLVGLQLSSCGEGQVCATGAVQHWNGTAWQHVPRGVPIGYGVDAVAANDIWGVGPGPSVFHFDGQTWVEVPAGVTTAELWSVEASSANDIWAAGDALGPQASALVEHARSATSGAVVGHTNVSYAVVSWFGPENGSVETDPFGDYAAGGLTAGTYTFVAGAQGCQPDSAQVTVIAGETIRQDLQMTC